MATPVETQASPDTVDLLVIDDEANMRHMLKQLLTQFGYAVDTAADGGAALNKVKEKTYDFILCDIRMPEIDGLAFLDGARQWIEDSTVIMMSAYGSLATALEAMKKGAYDYISKPFQADEVQLVLKKAEERERLRRENRQLKHRIRHFADNNQFGRMIAASSEMQSVFALAEKAGQISTTVMITGESGTGKELIARGVHFTGTRAEKPWIPVNCGGIPDSLMESELFGVVKGAYTGADQDRLGLFREADAGTLFLDEIGELPMPLQVKLLRVLQENEVRPVGGTRAYPLNVRVIAATARRLEDEIAAGRFREDLYYRLNVLPIVLPPLRERTEDIAPLCRLFINRHNPMLGTRIEALSAGAMTALIAHPWPGNVRELENVIQRAMVMTESGVIGESDIAVHIQTVKAPPAHTIIDGYSLKRSRKRLEKHMIEVALLKTGGNRTHAARLLEISHPSLLAKIKLYEIDG